MNMPPSSMDVAASDAVYAPMQPAVSPATSDIRRDISYGPDERQAADVAIPEGLSAGLRTVLVFVHGGGFTSGARRRPGTPFHDNVLHWANASGMVGVNLGYRLAPQHRWPSAGLDVALGLEWVLANASRWGGDPTRIVALGHSAGATHLAEAVVQLHAEGGLRGAPAACVLVSGIYSMASAAGSAGRQAYFGADPAGPPGSDLVPRFASVPLPALVTSSDIEPVEFENQARALVEARTEAGMPVQYERLARQNHFSPIFSLGSEDSTFAALLKSFVHRNS